MVCVTGGRECNGCGRCFKDVPEFTCPICGADLRETDKVYLNGIGDLIGCENCVDEKEAYVFFEE